ncbi:MAG: C25 family cysteine peptidase [Phormidesmis sp.]
MTTEKIYFNGVNGSTGRYLFPPLTAEELANIAKGDEFDPKEISELKQKNQQVKGTESGFALVEGLDPKNLAETGWGVIFSANADPAIKAALQELLDHRKKQATQKKEHYYQEYAGPKGYRPDESKNKFLGRHGVGPGPADPDKMPYYLMIVGDPQTIPFRFQHQLDVQYAVGRIHFDTPAEYAQYAHSVVKAETEGIALPRRARFFGVKNSDDKATQLSAQNLIQPLAKWMVDDQKDNHWSVETTLGEAATKAELEKLLGGKETPAFLFTASHGMGFDHGDRRQLLYQGALLCQDWPGPRTWESRPIPSDFYFSCDDVSDDASLWGLIAFHFACYSAGTPQFDEFSHRKNSSERPEIAPHSFISSLSKRLLSHPKGGALAVIGHVERAWGCSFEWQDAGTQLAVFESTLKRLLEGHTVGSAIEYFNERYAELSTDLNVELEDIKYGGEFDVIALSSMWTANNDARGYTIVGDPAVKLPVGGSTETNTATRRVLETSPQDFSASPSTASVSTEQVGNVSDAVTQAHNTLNQSLEQLIDTINQGAADPVALKRSISATVKLLEALNELT